jgi:hypothetical protein
MLKKIILSTALWMLAFVITVFSAIYQRRTGPTYPICGDITVNGSLVEYELLRTHGGQSDQPVAIKAPDTTISAVLVFRRHKTDDAWSRKNMVRRADSLVSALPHQPPAGKIEYHVEIVKGNQTVNIPQKENAVTRFKGDVPNWALVPHVFFMFFAMFLSTRTGLQALRKNAPIWGLAITTVIFLILGGFVFGPIVQKFAFGDYWTGFPYGTDLTDNKTLIALFAWVFALFMLYRFPKARLWVAGAAVIMFLIFMIPHSMHGSELDYNQLDAQNEHMAQPEPTTR